MQQLIIILFVLEGFHYVMGCWFFIALDFSAQDVDEVKIWKALITGGVGMLIHRSICILSKKLKTADCNWTLKEWIRK